MLIAKDQCSWPTNTGEVILHIAIIIYRLKKSFWGRNFYLARAHTHHGVDHCESYCALFFVSFPNCICVCVPGYHCSFFRINCLVIKGGCHLGSNRRWLIVVTVVYVMVVVFSSFIGRYFSMIVVRRNEWSLLLQHPHDLSAENYKRSIT